jgi:hypothetical protein
MSPSNREPMIPTFTFPLFGMSLCRSSDRIIRKNGPQINTNQHKSFVFICVHSWPGNPWYIVANSEQGNREQVLIPEFRAES